VLNISRKKDKLSGDAFLQKKEHKQTFVQKNMKRKKEELKKELKTKTQTKKFHGKKNNIFLTY
jgi:hypothetical protein